MFARLTKLYELLPRFKNHYYYCCHCYHYYCKQFQGPVLKLRFPCHRPVLVIKHAPFHVLPSALCHGFPNAAEWESSLGIYSSCLMSGEAFPLGLLSLAATKQPGRSSVAALLPATSAADKILKPSIPRHEWAIKTMCQKWKLFHHNFSQFFLTKAKQVSWIHISYNLIHYASGHSGSVGNYLSLVRAFESARLVNKPSPRSSRYFFLHIILSVNKGRHALQHFIFW